MKADLIPQLRRLIREELASLRIAELAIVQEIHPHESDGDKNNYGLTVRLRDSGLVLAEVPLLTARLGLAAIPPVGSLVLVQFVGGDINAPVVTGSLFNDEDRPPLHEDGQLVINLPNDASADDALHVAFSSIDDKKIELNLGSALKMTLSDGDPAVLIDVGGNAKITIDSSGGVTVESSVNLELKGGGNVTLQADGNMELKASGKMTIQGSVINLN